MNNVKVNDILNIYSKEISKNVKNKDKLFQFEKNKMQIINEVYDILRKNEYDGGHYNIFLISEPKKRIIMSLNVKDKLINHYITRYVLEKKLNKYLDDRNIATRKNMGIDYGIKKIKKYIEINKKYENIYILKIDISKYFYSIDHSVLKSMLINKLDTNEYNFICKIIDSTNNSYINEKIKSIKNKYNNNEVQNLPYYINGKGLPIGNMTSQFLSIFYLHKLDHYIINNLHLKYYIRYMDDIIIIHNDKRVLKDSLKVISDLLNNVYRLKINKCKTKILNAKQGFYFLGYVFKVINKKTIMKYKRESITRIKDKIKLLVYQYQNKIINLDKAFSSIMTYYYRKYGNIVKIRRIIDKYFFEVMSNEK